MSNTQNFVSPSDLDPQEDRLQRAIKLFEEGKVSSGYAADMAGYNKPTFIELLGNKGIPVYNYSVEDFERELETIDRLVKNLGGNSTPEK